MQLAERRPRTPPDHTVRRLHELCWLVAGDDLGHLVEPGGAQVSGGHRQRSRRPVLAGESANRAAQLVMELPLVDQLVGEALLHGGDLGEVVVLDRQATGVPVVASRYPDGVEHPGQQGDAEHAGSDAERQPHPTVGERREEAVVGGNERGWRAGVHRRAHHLLLRRCRSNSSNTPGTTLGSPDKRIAAIPRRLSVARVSSARRRIVGDEVVVQRGVVTVEGGDAGAGSDDVQWRARPAPGRSSPRRRRSSRAPRAARRGAAAGRGDDR